MPKEYVHGSELILDEASGKTDHPVVVVGWSKETGDMQIVTRLFDAEVPSVEEQDHGIPVQYGYYISLDRGGINNLIRILRRARDQTFGKDE